MDAMKELKKELNKAVYFGSVLYSFEEIESLHAQANRAYQKCEVEESSSRLIELATAAIRLATRLDKGVGKCLE